MRGAALLLALVTACARTSPSPAPPAASTAPVVPASTPSPSADSHAKNAPCDAELPCQVLASPEVAFDKVLEQRPRVLAIGETHAQKDAPGIDSATKRTTELLLPKLSGRASDLVLELWVANGACGKQERKVEAQQKDVTVTQAATNPNEFITLGNAAKRLGIQPHVLVPPCDDYARILDAGAGDIDAMLEMIARLSAQKASELLAKGGDEMIVLYGGAMHNDVAPRPGREAWSFGPALLSKSGGRYVELDVIVPELVKDTDAWRAQAWYAHYDGVAHDGETLLFTTGPRSFALIFPKTHVPKIEQSPEPPARIRP